MGVNKKNSHITLEKYKESLCKLQDKGIKSYVRVGCRYYKIVEYVNVKGSVQNILIRWNENFIKQDFGSKSLSKIRKFDTMSPIPDHKNYKEYYGTCYNSYHKLNHLPVKGDCTNTLTFLEHIFGKQLELGLDYLKLIYEDPLHFLPILCLVSQERETGKSTFLKWLKEIYGYNFNFLDNHSLSSNFNNDWSGKLMLALDEPSTIKKDIVERLKYLATSNIHNVEAKGRDRYEEFFFGKILMCSNYEDTFIQIDEDEIRFWVVKVSSIKEKNDKLLEEMVAEIPAFLAFLVDRDMFSRKRSRMWFDPNEIETEALIRLKKRSGNGLDVEIMYALLDIMDFFEKDEIRFTIKELINLCKHFHLKSDQAILRKTVKERWGLKPVSNALQYEAVIFLSKSTYTTEVAKGRYFTLTRKKIEATLVN